MGWSAGRARVIVRRRMSCWYVRGWGLGLAALSSLIGCNLLLGNEAGQVAPVDDASSDEPLDGAVVATGDAATLDASTPTDADAGDPRVCRKPAAPTAACFDDATCSASSLPITWGALPSELAEAHPHGLALWGGSLYYSAQETTPAGRNDTGNGQLYRVDTALTQTPTLVSPTGQLSPSAATIRDGFLFWRTWDAITTRSAIHRLELARWSGEAPCMAAECGYEAVASELPGRVNELWAASPNEVFARINTGLRQFRKAGSWAPVTLPASLTETKGRLREGLWTGWISDATASDAGQTTLYSLFEGAPQARLWWHTPGPNSTPIPFESSLLATSCDDTFLYEQWATPALRRVNLDAGIEAGADQKFAPIDCPSCESALTFAHSADARFSYLARPNSGGLVAIEHQSGAARKLVEGDVWDVVTDDDAIYFTQVGAHLISRIAKH